MAADMTLDKDGNLVDSRFVNGIMFSRARLTYKEVQAALEDPEGEAAAGIEECAPGVCAMLENAAELADILMERRTRRFTTKVWSVSAAASMTCGNQFGTLALAALGRGSSASEARRLRYSSSSLSGPGEGCTR